MILVPGPSIFIACATHPSCIQDSPPPAVLNLGANVFWGCARLVNIQDLSSSSAPCRCCGEGNVVYLPGTVCLMYDGESELGLLILRTCFWILSCGNPHSSTVHQVATNTENVCLYKKSDARVASPVLSTQRVLAVAATNHNETTPPVETAGVYGHDVNHDLCVVVSWVLSRKFGTKNLGYRTQKVPIARFQSKFTSSFRAVTRKIGLFSMCRNLECEKWRHARLSWWH